MQAFRSLLGQGGGDSEAPASVLAEWNRYSTEADGPSQSDRLVSSMEEGGAKVQSFLNSSFSKVPSSSNFTYFAVFLGAGILFLVLSFTIFLPVIIVAPAKFASSFTLGSALTMAAFTSLRGWRSQLGHMMSQERLPFSVGYIGSMVGTLYAALVMHSYVLSIVCCCLQVCAMLYYIMSYFPGGVAGVKFILGMFYGMCTKCLGGVQRSLLG